MHWKPVYRFIHKVHHESTSPTPFTAFAFHPLEAVIEAAIFPIMIFSVPLHPVVLITFATYSNLVNVLGHLGYEIFPHGFTRGWLGFINTSTHHNQHHEKFHCNYGFYFNVWDRLMNTNHSTYHERFNALTKRSAKPTALLPGAIADSQ